jgi:hypothetical protein
MVASAPATGAASNDCTAALAASSMEGAGVSRAAVASSSKDPDSFTVTAALNFVALPTVATLVRDSAVRIEKLFR